MKQLSQRQGSDRRRMPPSSAHLQTGVFAAEENEPPAEFGGWDLCDTGNVQTTEYCQAGVLAHDDFDNNPSMWDWPAVQDGFNAAHPKYRQQVAEPCQAGLLVEPLHSQNAIASQNDGGTGAGRQKEDIFIDHQDNATQTGTAAPCSDAQPDVREPSGIPAQCELCPIQFWDEPDAASDLPQSTMTSPFKPQSGRQDHQEANGCVEGRSLISGELGHSPARGMPLQPGQLMQRADSLSFERGAAQDAGAPPGTESWAACSNWPDDSPSHCLQEEQCSIAFLDGPAWEEEPKRPHEESTADTQSDSNAYALWPDHLQHHSPQQDLCSSIHGRTVGHLPKSGHP